MMSGDKDDDQIEPITDEQLGDVTGGRRSIPTTVTGKLIGNDTIVGVNNDTLFAGPSDLTSFDLGASKKK